MTIPDNDDYASTTVTQILGGIQSFAEEMRAKGIHVALGTNYPVCVTCGRPFPCQPTEADALYRWSAVRRLFDGEPLGWCSHRHRIEDQATACCRSLQRHASPEHWEVWRFPKTQRWPYGR